MSQLVQGTRVDPHDVPAPRAARSAAAVPEERTVTVMLVDDTPDIVSLLRELFLFHPGVDICAEAKNGLEAVELRRAHRPDVVVMDLRMPAMSGLEAAARMLAEDPDQRVLLFSASLRDADRGVAEVIGVERCIDKRELYCVPDLVRTPGEQARRDG